MEPIPSPSVHGEIEEDVQQPLEVGENVDIPNEVELENEGEQPIQEPPPQPELRRSVRDKQPSRKYSPDEFVTIFSKNIVFLAPGVTPSPVAEEKFRPLRLFMELAYARCQRMKKEHGLDEIFMGGMGGIALDPSRTCTNRPPFDVSLP
ncbi:hypothetical protein RHGRI_025576 [Rhododendron griersonianum]|uniref:Uncharacterized protein n=1 Tax=Rhododendron griersonianum TaxID=479676 RepID=A0AAV6IPN3_9ERIC|nr:hypothetical protein RHGRI_025576 [Rhododendron griersonianum]